MGRIDYQPSLKRYLILQPNTLENFAVTITCRNPEPHNIVPEMIALMLNYHRVYVVGEWVIETLNNTLILYRIPEKAYLKTHVELVFPEKVDFNYVMQNSSEDDDPDSEAALSIERIVLDDSVYLEGGADEETEKDETPVRSELLPRPGQAVRPDPRLQEEIDRLTALLEERDQQIEQLRQENGILTARGLEADIEQLGGQIGNLSDEMDMKRIRKEQLEAEMEMMLAEKERLESDIAEQSSRAGKIQLTMGDLRRELEEYERRQVEAHAASQLVDIDTEATLNALREQMELILCTGDAAALLNQADIREQMKNAKEAVESVQKTLVSIIRVREAADEQIKASLRRRPSKGDL